MLGMTLNLFKIGLTSARLTGQRQTQQMCYHCCWGCHDSSPCARCPGIHIRVVVGRSVPWNIWMETKIDFWSWRFVGGRMGTWLIPDFQRAGATGSGRCEAAVYALHQADAALMCGERQARHLSSSSPPWCCGSADLCSLSGHGTTGNHCLIILSYTTGCPAKSLQHAAVAHLEVRVCYDWRPTNGV